MFWKNEKLQMRYVLFSPLSSDALHVGCLGESDIVVDITAFLLDQQHGLIQSMKAFLMLGDAGRKFAEAALANPLYHRKNSLVRLRAPIYDSYVSNTLFPSSFQRKNILHWYELCGSLPGTKPTHSKGADCI